jgi:hypothetical protein
LPGAVEDLGEVDAGPFRGADCSQPPGFAIDGRIEGVAAVAGAFEGEDAVSAGMRDSSRRLRASGRSTRPVTSSLHAEASIIGAWKWLRT